MFFAVLPRNYVLFGLPEEKLNDSPSAEQARVAIKFIDHKKTRLCESYKSAGRNKTMGLITAKNISVQQYIF